MNKREPLHMVVMIVFKKDYWYNVQYIYSVCIYMYIHRENVQVSFAYIIHWEGSLEAAECVGGSEQTFLFPEHTQ